MFEAQHSKRVETDRTQTSPAKNLTNLKQRIQRTGDSTHLPVYTQVWGNQPPPQQALSEQSTQLPQEDALQYEQLQQMDGYKSTDANGVLMAQRDADSPTRIEEGQLQSRIEVARAAGHTLDKGAQQRLEQGLGRDLSGVQVHTDSEADHLSRSVNALAFTTGVDIFFRSGAYSPSTAQGMYLLAHETAHVVQQAAGPVAGTPSVEGVFISDPSDRFEQAAEAQADQVLESMVAPAQRMTTLPLKNQQANSNERAQGQATLSVQRVISTWDKKPDTLWVKDPGTRYEEEIAFADEDELNFAQIAGQSASNFPVIDDFRDGVATSLKTIDIIKNYRGGPNDSDGLKRLEQTLKGYKEALMQFSGKNWGGREVKPEEIQTLRLQIAYPPDAPQTHVNALAAFAGQATDPEELAINKIRKRALKKATEIKKGKRKVIDYSQLAGRKKQKLATGEGEQPPNRLELSREFLEAPNTEFEVGIQEVQDIWTNAPGYKYEQTAFPTDPTRQSANIGGTYPVIDDFRNGIATSLKTINIVERFTTEKGVMDVEKLMEGYLADLAAFEGGWWPVGTNFQGDPSLLITNPFTGADRVWVDPTKIVGLVLQVAIPPLTGIIQLHRNTVKKTEEAREALRKKQDKLKNMKIEKKNQARRQNLQKEINEVNSKLTKDEERDELLITETRFLEGKWRAITQYRDGTAVLPKTNLNIPISVKVEERE